MSTKPPSPESRWGRHWKWVVPVGCLGLIVFSAALTISIFTLVKTAMTSSWAYTNAVQLAGSNPRVEAALGRPLETGWFVSGNINVSGPAGEAELSIPLEGPSGSGTLYVMATKRAGRWTFDLVELDVDGREHRIDLLAGTVPGS